jgi:hypothetical protein
MVSEFITLDGVVEAPGGEPSHPHTGWVFDYHVPELERYKAQELRDAESMLLGRVTYEGFAEAWPPRDGEIADLLNSMPKHVVSSTLTTPLAWSNSTLLGGDLLTGRSRSIHARRVGNRAPQRRRAHVRPRRVNAAAPDTAPAGGQSDRPRLAPWSDGSQPGEGSTV